MKRVRLFFVDNWQITTAYLLVIGGLWYLYFWRLSSLVPGQLPAERDALMASSSLKSIASNPLYAPHKFIEWVLIKAHLNNWFAARGVSATYAIAAVLLIYLLLRQWYTVRLSLIGTLLFASTTWFIATARLATPEITLMFSPLLVLFGLWAERSKQHSLMTFLSLLALGVLLYIPMTIWFVVIICFFQRKRIFRLLKEASGLSIALGLVGFLILLAPLLRAFLLNPNLLLSWLGLPTKFVFGASSLRSLLNLPVWVLLRGPSNPGHWLGRIPLLDVFTVSMGILGLYAFYKLRSLDRVSLFAGFFVIAIVLASFNNQDVISLILPYLFVVVTAGIAVLLRQWFTVFPRNPLARSLGLVLVSVVVALSVSYNLTRYFIAWRHAPATRATFSVSVGPPSDTIR